MDADTIINILAALLVILFSGIAWLSSFALFGGENRHQINHEGHKKLKRQNSKGRVAKKPAGKQKKSSDFKSDSRIFGAQPRVEKPSFETSCKTQHGIDQYQSTIIFPETDGQEKDDIEPPDGNVKNGQIHKQGKSTSKAAGPSKHSTSAKEPSFKRNLPQTLDSDSVATLPVARHLRRSSGEYGDSSSTSQCENEKRRRKKRNRNNNNNNSSDIAHPKVKRHLSIDIPVKLQRDGYFTFCLTSHGGLIKLACLKMFFPKDCVIEDLNLGVKCHHWQGRRANEKSVTFMTPSIQFQRTVEDKPHMLLLPAEISIFKKYSAKRRIRVKIQEARNSRNLEWQEYRQQEFYCGEWITFSCTALSGYRAVSYANSHNVVPYKPLYYLVYLRRQTGIPDPQSQFIYVRLFRYCFNKNADLTNNSAVEIILCEQPVNIRSGSQMHFSLINKSNVFCTGDNWTADVQPNERETKEILIHLQKNDRNISFSSEVFVDLECTFSSEFCDPQRFDIRFQWNKPSPPNVVNIYGGIGFQNPHFENCTVIINVSGDGIGIQNQFQNDTPSTQRFSPFKHLTKNAIPSAAANSKDQGNLIQSRIKGIQRSASDQNSIPAKDEQTFFGSTITSTPNKVLPGTSGNPSSTSVQSVRRKVRSPPIRHQNIQAPVPNSNDGMDRCLYEEIQTTAQDQVCSCAKEVQKFIESSALLLSGNRERNLDLQNVPKSLPKPQPRTITLDENPSNSLSFFVEEEFNPDQQISNDKNLPAPGPIPPLPITSTPNEVLPGTSGNPSSTSVQSVRRKVRNPDLQNVPKPLPKPQPRANGPFPPLPMTSTPNKKPFFAAQAIAEEFANVTSGSDREYMTKESVSSPVPIVPNIVITLTDIERGEKVSKAAESSMIEEKNTENSIMENRCVSIDKKKPNSNISSKDESTRSYAMESLLGSPYLRSSFPSKDNSSLLSILSGDSGFSSELIDLEEAKKLKQCHLLVKYSMPSHPIRRRIRSLSECSSATYAYEERREKQTMEKMLSVRSQDSLFTSELRQNKAFAKSVKRCRPKSCCY